MLTDLAIWMLTDLAISSQASRTLSALLLLQHYFSFLFSFISILPGFFYFNFS